MEIKKLQEKVKEKYNKKLLDWEKIEKAFHLNKKYLFLLAIILIFFLMSKKYFVFGAITLLSSFFAFYHSKINRTPMDLKLTLFLGLFITRYYGLFFTLVFFVISDILPSLLGGESVNGSDLFFFGWFFIVNAMVYLFPHVPLVILGPVLVIIEAIGSFFINSTFGIPVFMSFLVSILTIIVRIIYFLIFSGILESIFKVIK